MPSYPHHNYTITIRNNMDISWEPHVITQGILAKTIHHNMTFFIINMWIILLWRKTYSYAWGTICIEIGESQFANLVTHADQNTRRSPASSWYYSWASFELDGSKSSASEPDAARLSDSLILLLIVQTSNYSLVCHVLVQCLLSSL